MNLKHILRILRARYKVLVIVTLLSAMAGVATAHLMPKMYTAETAVMVDIRSPDPIATVLLPASAPGGTMGTQIDIVRSDRVARKVVRMLRLVESPAVKEAWLEATGGTGKIEDWMSDRLKKGLSVAPSRDSSVLTIAYRGTDPAFVAAVANAYAQAYIEVSVELKVEPAKQYADWFAEQATILRENVEKAQARLSEFQRKSGIVTTEGAMDYEIARLTDLTTRLAAAQAEARDAQSRQRAGSSEALPDVLQNSVVASLRSNIASLEVKVKEAGANLGRNHPQYQRMELELAELRNRLAAETSHVASGYTATGAVGKAKEAELRAAIEAQKKRVLDMRSQRDQMAVLVRDVETARRAYEAVTTRLSQTHLDSQANRTNLTVLTPAVEPVQPSFPRPLEQMLAIAVLLGLALGCAAAYGLEMLDRRIRSTEDLAEMLQLPVLTVIPKVRVTPRLAFRGGRLLPR